VIDHSVSHRGPPEFVSVQPEACAETGRADPDDGGRRIRAGGAEDTQNLPRTADLRQEFLHPSAKFVRRKSVQAQIFAPHQYDEQLQMLAI
jgi:hypothetical protein